MGVGRKSSLALGLILAVGLALVHARVGNDPDLTGPLLVLDHAFDVALVAALLFSGLVAGLDILRRLGLGRSPPLDRVIFGTALGIGVIGTVNLGLGLLGALHPVALLAVPVLLLALARRELAGAIRTLRTLAHASVGGSAPPGIRLTALALTALAGLFLLALALPPQIDWDSLLLHLRVPSQFLSEGRVYVPPDNLPSGFASLIHMTYLPLLASGSAAGPAVLSAALALLLALTVFAVARYAFDSDAGHLALIGVWGSSIVLLVAVTPRVDVSLAFFALAAHYALLRAFPRDADDPQATGSPGSFLLLSALLVGLMVSVKYQGFVYAVALSPLVLAAAGGDPGTRTRRSLVFAAVAGAVALPWIAKNLLLFQAPFAPMFTGPTLPPWLETLYGSRVFPIEGPAAFSGVVWQLSEPFDIVHFFFAPHRLTIEAEAMFYFSSPLLLLLPLALGFARTRRAAWVAAPTLIYATLLLLYAPSTNLRYLIPAVAGLLVVAAGTAMTALRTWFPERGARRLALLGLVVPLTFLPSVFAISFWAMRSEAFPHLVGASSAREFAATRPFESVLPVVVAEVTERVPEDGKLLLLFEPRGYPFGESTLQDSQMNHWPLIALAPVDLECLGGSGVTHVLLNEGTLQYRLDRGFEPRDFEWQAFPAFRDRCLTPVWDFHGYTLFEVLGPPDGASR